MAKRLDEAIELLDFGSREELVESVVRRFLDEYRLLTLYILN